MAIDKDTLISQEGAHSYYEKRGVYCNPYPVNTPEHNHFERGWSQALRKDDARLVNPTTPSVPLVPKYQALLEENQYAAIKGRSRPK
ncbi:hypothetical protein H6G33_37945 [Calothrix sp. FACHB-1219]|uniref:hypothetical protein n=1 Tax=Calothrix sp. FACHB-1219 TaxID=2692778 RepID=UPI00168306FD|nr:hypothetical protein [Calothrix sp. FACHB-1219]